MIENSSWRHFLRLRVWALLCIVALAACAADSPVAPGDTITPPPPPPDDPDTGMVTLSWDAPTSNADGSGPLTDLTGYTICYGSSSTQLVACQDVGNATTVELELPIGTHFIAVRAYDNWRNESDFSNVIEITIAVPQQS